MKARMLRVLLKADVRKLTRDPVMVVSALLPVVLAVLLRVGLPALEDVLASTPTPFELGPHRATIGAGALAISAMMGGWIVGFMLLEERVQRMLPAIGVTPLTRRGFVLWRVALPVAIALLGGLVLVGVGRCGVEGLGRALGAVGLMAIASPLFSLALVAFADNEVEGLALAKLGGLAFMLPLVTLYFDGPWLWLGGLLPPFWAVRLYAGGPWWLLGPGVLVSAVWAWALLRRLARRVE